MRIVSYLCSGEIGAQTVADPAQERLSQITRLAHDIVHNREHGVNGADRVDPDEVVGLGGLRRWHAMTTDEKLGRHVVVLGETGQSEQHAQQRLLAAHGVPGVPGSGKVHQKSRRDGMAAECGDKMHHPVVLGHLHQREGLGLLVEKIEDGGGGFLGIEVGGRVAEELVNETGQMLAVLVQDVEVEGDQLSGKIVWRYEVGYLKSKRKKSF